MGIDVQRSGGSGEARIHQYAIRPEGDYGPDALDSNERVNSLRHCVLLYPILKRVDIRAYHHDGIIIRRKR